jgi:Tol biopolymer transport system component
MSDLRNVLDRAIGPVDPSPDIALERTLKRVAQRQRRRRVGAIAVGLAASMVAVGVAVWALSGGRDEQPAAQKGTLMFVGGDSLTGENRLYTMNADGSELRSIPTGDLVPLAAVPSPDGDRIAMMAAESLSRGDLPRIRLYLMDARGGRIQELPVCPDDGCQGAISLSWSPDGRTLAFPGNGVGVHVVDVDTGRTRRLTGGDLDSSPAFSSDGRSIAFDRTEPDLEPHAQIWVMNVDGSGAHQVTDASFASEATQPAWSPDASTIAYTEGGEPGGTAGISVVGADGSAPRQLTACSFGTCQRFPTFPVWSPDGSRIGILLQDAGLTRSAVAMVDPETGELRVVRELAFSASGLSWQDAT